MIALARVEDTIEVEGIQVPDIKFPPAIEWGVAVPEDQSYPNFQIQFTRPSGQRVTTLWLGPYTVGAQTLYIVDAPKSILARLKNQLGDARVTPFVRALRNRAPIRAWAKAQGFTLIRNSAGKPVGVRTPLVLAGRNGGDLDLTDGETIDSIPEMLDLDD